MKTLSKVLSRIAIAPVLAMSVGVTLLAEAPPAQAQTCRFVRGNAQLVNGSQARLYNSSFNQPINIRSRATVNSTARHYGYRGDRVTVIDPGFGDDCYRWYYIEFNASGARGWVRGDLIERL